MWPLFFLTLLISILILYIPGSLFVASYSRSLPLILTSAPLVSIALYNLLSIIYGYLRIPASFFSVALPILLASLITFTIAALHQTKHSKSEALSTEKEFDEPKEQGSFISNNRKFLLLALLYLTVAAIISACFFLLPLDGPDSFVQDSDNSFHLSLIRSFLDSGDYSPLNANLFPEYPSEYLNLANSGRSFYPAAWHCLCALLSSATSCSVTLSANALNLALLSVVFPLSILAFLNSLFRKNDFVLAAGAFVSLAFAAFPWGGLYPALGPLYPNFLGLCLVPAICSLFIDYFEGKKNLVNTINYGLPFFCGLIACALSHPNVLFCCLVILSPYCFIKIAQLPLQNNLISKLLASLFLVLVILFWLFAYNLPFMQAIVHFEWAPITNISGAISSITNLSLRIGFEQPVLALVVGLGIIAHIVNRNNRWLLISLIISCVMYVVSAATDGELENILTGFWYSDPTRIAALVALCGLPLAASGLGMLYHCIEKMANYASAHIMSLKRFNRVVATTGVAVLTLSFTFVVYHSSNSVWSPSDTTTAFGNIEYCLDIANDSKRDNTFDPEERLFCERVSEIVNDDYLIFNCADDGSPFAYALYDLNLCYRRSSTLENETEYSRLLRLEIDDIYTSEEVRQYLAEANVRYILVLDYGGEPLPERCYYGYYTWEKWAGINSITDATPGLSILLSEGDMRLYEIDWDELG